MWISKKLGASSNENLAETGKITISSENCWEATTSTNLRNIEAYGPFGFDYLAPCKKDVLIIPTANGNVSLGTKINSSLLKSGEVRIYSDGGASIVLKNNGDVVINGLVISKDGEIQNGD